MTIWDITPPLSPRSPVFPGDEPFSVSWRSRAADGSGANVSAISLSPHDGAHVDAPLHLFDGAADAASLPLEPFLGECLVIDLSAEGRAGEDLIGPEALPAAGEPLPPRVLFKTRRRRRLRWTMAFRAFAPALVEALLARGVRLAGTDAPSIDPADSEALPSHRLALADGLFILENLELSAVPAGRYRLTALPLALSGAEASPVRAVLEPLR